MTLPKYAATFGVALALLFAVVCESAASKEARHAVARAARTTSPWERFVALGADDKNPTWILMSAHPSSSAGEREWAHAAFGAMREALKQGDPRAGHHVFDKWGLHTAFDALREEVEPGRKERRAHEAALALAPSRAGVQRCCETCAPERWSFDESLGRCRCEGGGSATTGSQ